MSLILDALRRADRERERDRGGVPSLHTQMPPPWSPAGDPAHADGAPRPWLWLAAGLGGGLVLAAVWALWSATPGAATVEPRVAPPPVPTPTPPPTPAAQVSPALDKAPPASDRAGPSSPPPLQAKSTPATKVEARPAPAERARPEAPPPPVREPADERKPPAREVVKPEAAAPAADRPAAAPIRQLGELPAEVRSQLPALTIGGAMYSSKAANRRLIVNGQLLSEGDQVAPGLVLEEIRLKSAVLRWRDLRYEQGF